MAKRNVQNTKKVVEEPIEELNGVTDTTEQTNEPQTTAVEGTAAVEEIQEELSVQQEPDNSEQTNDTEGAELDTESKAETNGTKGNEADNPVRKDETEEVYKEAKAIIEKMVDEAIDESGILDEPKEVTEKRNRIASEVFQKNSNCKVLYFTADLVPFFVKSDAVRHGITLNVDTVVTINRK